MARVITLFRTWRITLGIAAASAAAGSIVAWQINDAFDAQRTLKREAAAARAAAIVVQRVEKANTITAEVGRHSAERQAVIRTEIQEIIREVPRYVSAEADLNCDVPVGFVRLHDAAAVGISPPAVSGSPAAPDDSTSGIELSTVAETVIGNYGICHAEREKLRSLQEWINAQAAAWDQN